VGGGSKLRSSLKFDRLIDAIGSVQRADPFAPVTVIVPSPYSRVQLRREVGRRRSFCNVAFRTWGEITADLARLEAGTALRVPSRATLHEALRQVLRNAPAALAAAGTSAAGRADLVAICTELWRANPTLRDALAAAGDRPRALVELVGALEATLGAAGFTDPGRLLDLAAAGTRQCTTPFISWFLAPATGRDAAVLDGLVRRGLMAATVDVDPDEATPLTAVAQCADPDEEVRTALRRALGALHEGVSLWQQAIVHPPTPRYRRIVHQQLAAAGIPVAGRASLTLAHSAAGRLLTGALSLAGGEWEREAVMRWLASLPLTEDDGTPVPAQLWDDVSARAGVVAGLAQWRSRLERFSQAGSARDPYVAHSAAEAHAARSLASFVERLAAELGNDRRRWSEWAQWASGFLDRHLRPELGSPTWPTHEQLAVALVADVLDELGQLDAVAADADLASFCHALEQELATRPMRGDEPGGAEQDPVPTVAADVAGLGGPVGSGIFVGTPAEARGLAFAAVHLVGLDDEDLPGSEGGQPLALIPRSVRDQWPAGSRAAEVLSDLRAVVALAGEATATWPSVDPRSGRELARSRWLDDGQPLSPLRQEAVPSFAASVSERARSTPVSGAERRLHALVEAAGAGLPVETHPAALGETDRRVPPLAAALGSARSAARGEFSRYEGDVGAGGALPIVGEVAPTALEDYATCPRKYLLGRELGVHPPIRPEATDELSPSDRGTLVHEILARYVRERIEDGAPPSVDRLLEIARERFALAEEEGRCGPSIVAAADRSALEWELRRFVEEDQLEPVAVELPFGAGRGVEVGPDRLPAVEVGIGGDRTVRFGGRMDRLDRAPDGSLVVSDYKTGRQNQLRQSFRADPVARGTRLQLAVYALAARALAGPDRQIRSRYWLVSLNRSAPSFECQLDDRLVARLSEAVRLIVQGIEAGAFPAVPGNEISRAEGPTFENCTICPFDRVCPVDRGRRWRAQHEAPELAAVRALGAPPNEDLAGLVQAAELLEPL